MPQWTSERNWSANVFQETYARMMKALKNAHQQNGLAALHARSMPGLRHNNNNDDDKYREEIVGYFAFLCVWHRFVELVRRGKCKRYSKYNWRYSFHASNTSWILALKIQKWSVFHMTQLLRRKLKVKLKTKLHRKVQCRWYNLAGNRSISCVTQILFPYAVFAGLVLFFLVFSMKCIQVWRVTTIRKQRRRRNNKKLRRTTKAISFVTNMLLPLVMKNRVTLLHEGDYKKSPWKQLRHFLITVK